MTITTTYVYTFAWLGIYLIYLDSDFRRIDYMLSCPDGLSNMPGPGLPHLLYSAFWESADAAALILKEAIYDRIHSPTEKERTDKPNITKKTRWQRRRTTLKVSNLTFVPTCIMQHFLGPKFRA